uniref:peptidylprolyl isomerase n=1 Tax=Gouania willdenowi TaxID=441366 RepID=A0A8C5N798_GOUWI
MKSGNKIVMDQFMRRETDPQPPADEWLDIFRSNLIMKKVLQAGGGRDSMPQPGQIVKINLKTRPLDGTLVEELSELSFTLGAGEVIRALDVAVQLMGMGEKALILVPSKAEFEITLLEATDAPDLKLLPPTEIDLATCKREQGNVLDQRRDLKPLNNTIRDEVSMMMKKHSEDDEKMLENPSSTHKHQAMDEKMLENPSSAHKHQAMDEKMLENPSSTHKHQAMDEKMLENPSSTHKHQAMDEKMLEDSSSTHKHQAMDEKMLENPSSTHKHQAMDEKMLEDPSSTHKHQAMDEKMLEDSSSTHKHQAMDEKMLENPSSTHKHQAMDEKMLENPSSTHKHQAMDEKMLENPSSTHKHQAMDEKMLEDPSSTHKHQAMDEKRLEDPSSTHKHQAKSAWGLSWKWLLGATAVAIGGIALSVAIYARK